MAKKQIKKITSLKTEKTISMLFAGKSKIAKKFAGKHVLVVGGKEVKNKTINLRCRDKKGKKEMPVKEFLELCSNKKEL